MQRIITLLFMFITFPIFCIDWQTELKSSFISEKSLPLGGYEYGNVYQRQKNKLKIIYNVEDKYLKLPEKIWIPYYEEFDLPECLDIFSQFVLKGDGFLYAKIANEPYSCEPIKEVPVIFGDEFTFAIPGMVLYRKEIGSESYKEELFYDGKYENGEKFRFFSSVYNDSIKKVSSSSHLIEKSKGIEFDYSGINLDWYLVRNGEFAADQINPYCFPWVENAEGCGIGEWVEFELNKPSALTYILNGFVDGSRMHLYKENSRIKEAEFLGWTEDGKEIKMKIHFEDFVYFKTVQFSEPVIKFRITIKEVYPGEKWQDTAISAVMFPVTIDKIK